MSGSVPGDVASASPSDIRPKGVPVREPLLLLLLLQPLLMLLLLLPWTDLALAEFMSEAAGKHLFIRPLPVLARALVGRMITVLGSIQPLFHADCSRARGQGEGGTLISWRLTHHHPNKHTHTHTAQLSHRWSPATLGRPSASPKE